MDSRAGAVDPETPQIDDASIPTVGRVVARTVPACAVAVLGFPVLARFLPDDSDALPEPWWLLAGVLRVGLTVLVQYLARAPRPRFDERVGRERWRGALSSAPRFGTVPADPGVRTAAGVVACNNIEGCMTMEGPVCSSLR